MEPVVPLRTRLAGWSLAAAGACLAVAPFLEGLGHPSAAAQADGMATGAAGSAAKVFVMQAAAMLVIPGLAALVGRTRGRGAGAVISGAVVLGAGMFGLYGFLLLSGLEDAAAGDGRLDPAIAAALDQMEGRLVALPMFVRALLFAHLLGIPWLSWALVRAGQVRWWVAAVATLGTLLAFFGSGTLLESPGWVLIGVALVAIAVTLVGQPDRAYARRALPPLTSAPTR